MLGGTSRVIRSDAAVTVDKDGLLVESEKEETEIMLWPPEKGAKSLCAKGACSIHRVTFSLPQIPVAATSLSDTRHILTIPAGCLKDVYDARLCIAYEGDAAQ